ncbi:MAG: MFS transporter [Alphaproteobacteria bacterium]|nr:MFS transporter [Alphaproteobacteria bacterium]
MSESVGAGSASKHTTLIFIAVTASTAAVTYNSLAVITAIPVMKAEFDMSLTMTQWIMNGYSLACAVLVAAMGRFGDMFGHLRVIVLGMGCFLLGSLAACFAFDTVVVITGRVLQGIGAAAILSTSLAILNNAVPEEKRASAIGLWSAVVALGMGLGTAIGGVLTSVSWRAVFAFDLLLIVPALIMALRVMRSEDRQSEGPREAIDFSGLVLLVLFLGPLAFALTHGQEAGWTAVGTMVPLLVGIACGIALVVVERRQESALIRMDFFRRRRYVAGTVGMCIAGVNTSMFVFFYILFAQSPDGLSYSAIAAGLSLLPFTLAMFLLSVGVPRVPAMARSVWLIPAAMAVAAAGFWFAQGITSASTIADTWWRFVVIGGGAGLAYSLLPRTALSALTEKDAGQGSGVANTFLYFGLTMGVVVGGIASAMSLRTSLTSVVQKLGVGPEEKDRLVHVLVHGSPGEIEAVFEKAAASGPTDLKQATQAAIESSFGDVMLVGAAVSLVGLVLMLWLLRGRPDADAKTATGAP